MPKDHPLSKFVPQAALPGLVRLLDNQPLHFIIEKERSSKYGDYLPARKAGDRHRITVNGTLNPYSFLITTIHEYAHFTHRLEVGKSRIQPHGADWKRHFQKAMKEFLNKEVFPEPLLSILINHMKNPKATSTADIRLYEALMKFDEPINDGTLLLRDLEEGLKFRTKDGKVFIKGPQQRKRFLCQRVDNNMFYRVHPLISVYALG